MSENRKGSPGIEELQEKLAEQEAQLETLAAELKKANSRRAPLSEPLHRGTRPGQPNHVVAFDGRNKHQFNDRFYCDLWNGRVVMSWDGAVAYGETQRFIGERAIRDALNPTINGKGQVVQEPWIPTSEVQAMRLIEFFSTNPDPPTSFYEMGADGQISNLVFMPAEYEHTEEKGRYLAQQETYTKKFLDLSPEELKAHQKAGTAPMALPNPSYDPEKDVKHVDVMPRRPYQQAGGSEGLQEL